jgi:hypothetical protein
VSPTDRRSLARHLVIALAEDFPLVEVADVLTIASQLARKAIEIRDRDRRDPTAPNREHREP